MLVIIFVYASDGEQLALLTEFIEQGKLQPIIDRVVPLAKFKKRWTIH